MMVINKASPALIILCLILMDSGSTERSGRNKRFIVFPFGGTFKLVIGIGIPVKLGSKQSMAVGWNFQFQYAEAVNATQLETYPPIVSARSRDKREAGGPISDRELAYSGVESLLNSHGIDGRSCLLRSICENVQDPLNHDANGLYGHLLHIVLTPDYGGDDGEFRPDLNRVYLEAKKAGEFGVDCLSLYPECPHGNGLLDMITVLDY